MWGELQKLVRFHRGLPRFLATPMSAADCAALLETTLREREENLLRVLKRAVFEHPPSPYLPLLRRAGAEFGDVAALVRREGVEAALERLAREGVQVSLDEFKGRTPVVRTGLEYAVRAEDFDNPLLAGEFEVMSGGTSGRRQRLTIDLDLLVFEAAARHLFLSSHGLLERPLGLWRAIPPGSSGIKHVLRSAKLGRPVERWFTPKPVAWDRLQWKSSIFLYSALWHGRGGILPRPVFAPPATPQPVVEWLAAKRAAGRPAVLACPVNAAARVAECARRQGADIAGTVMWVGGEPLSRAKQTLIEACGCSTVNGYALSEAGTLGLACANRSAPDEIHVLRNKAALIAQPGSVEPETGAPRLLLTTLLPASPKVLLNVDTGDRGVLSERRCGCPLEAAGYPVHLHTIRPDGKLTAGGMHFTARDARQLVEEVLPQRFGGSPLEYQLAEVERQGQTRVALLVSPAVGPLDEAQVAEAALAFLGSLSPGHRMMSEHWARSGIFEVWREEPAVSAAGKAQPVRARERE